MNTPARFRPLAITLAVVALAGTGYGLYRLGLQQGQANQGGAQTAAAMSGSPAARSPAMPSTTANAPDADGEPATRRHLQAGLKAGDVDPLTGRKILFYQDPMVPGNKFDKPGKSPFMDMLLVPVFAGTQGDAGELAISPRMQQNLGLRTATVAEGVLAPQLVASGSITFNEREQSVVQARANGFVEKLHVRATLDPVRAGQPLAELYVPDWVAAQEEYLSVKRMQGANLSPLLDAARARLRQAGMSEEQVRAVEASGRVLARTTITAPQGGVVTELLAREGMAVAPGATLFRINALASVWAVAEVPESQAALLRPGAKVVATSAAAPGQRFAGTVQALLPDVNPATRTLKVRMQLANPGGHLVPGMSVSMQFDDARAAKALLVPSDAVLQTGQRSVVMLAEDGGHFRPVQVQTGLESGGQTEIRAGLQAGQKVVVSAQFLIDSEASLRGLEARLNGGGTGGEAASVANTANAAKPPASDPHAGHAMPSGAKP